MYNSDMVSKRLSAGPGGAADGAKVNHHNDGHEFVASSVAEVYSSSPSDATEM